MSYPDEQSLPWVEAILPIALADGAAEESCFSAAVSAAGLILVSFHQRPAQQLLKLQITLPNSDELAIHGMVDETYCLEEDQPDGLWSVTVIFYSMRQASERRWLKFVREREREAAAAEPTPPPRRDRGVDPHPPATPRPRARGERAIVPADRGVVIPMPPRRPSAPMATPLPRDSRPPWAEEQAPIVSNANAAASPQRRTAIPPPKPALGTPYPKRVEQLSPHGDREGAAGAGRYPLPPGARRPTPEVLARKPGASPVVYKIPLPTLEAMAGFAETALSVRGVVVRTEDLRSVGTPVVVRVVHALSKDEFHLPGEVVEHYAERPGVAVGFTKLTRRTVAEYHRFVARGIPDEWPELEGWAEETATECTEEEMRDLSYVNKCSEQSKRATAPHRIPADTTVLRESMLMPLENLTKK